MRIVDLLKKKSIQLNAAPKSKSEAIDMLVYLQVKGENISDKEEYKIWCNMTENMPTDVRQRRQPLFARYRLKYDEDFHNKLNDTYIF